MKDVIRAYLEQQAEAHVTSPLGLSGRDHIDGDEYYAYIAGGEAVWALVSECVAAAQLIQTWDTTDEHRTLASAIEAVCTSLANLKRKVGVGK